MVAAHGALGIAAEFEFTKARSESVVMDELAHKRLAQACQKFNGLHGLKAANDAGKHA